MAETRRVNKEDFPSYLEKGSIGPVVNLVLAFLLGYVRGIKDADSAVDEFSELSQVETLQLDGIYGECAVACMKAFQGQQGNMDADGGCGPQTRAHLKEVFGFDLEQAARSTGGDTLFVQPDGTGLVWNPQG